MSKEICAYLEGRPVVEGDILYDMNASPLRVVLPTWCKDLPLRLEIIEKRGRSFWATDTHFQGRQVLFWQPTEQMIKRKAVIARSKYRIQQKIHKSFWPKKIKPGRLPAISCSVFSVHVKP